MRRRRRPRASRSRFSGRRRSTPQVLSGEAWQDLATTGFDPPRLFSAYLHTLRWNCVTATDPRLFQSPFRAGIRIDAYQLEPLRKALLLPRVNLFIADDVGLGKTIEAGLIARELLLRKKVRDIVVACPPSMLLQWQDELEDRFGLTFEILDQDYIARVRVERGFGVNPWTTHSRFLVSHRLLIDEAYAGRCATGSASFEAGLPADPRRGPPRGAPSSGPNTPSTRKITRAVRDLAPRFEHRLFLSATPAQRPLQQLLRPAGDPRPAAILPWRPGPGKKLLEDVMVRRLKEDLREVAGGFPRREVQAARPRRPAARCPRAAPLGPPRRVPRAPRSSACSGETKRKQAAAGLLISGSSSACSRRSRPSPARSGSTGGRSRSSGNASGSQAQPERRRAGRSRLCSPAASGSDDERAKLSEEELQAEEDAQIEAAIRSDHRADGRRRLVPCSRKSRQLLDEMTEVAEAARGLPDARCRASGRLDPEHMCPGPAASRAKPARPGEPARWNDDPRHHLHRVRRHQALPPAAARGRHRGYRPGRRADRHLPRPDAARQSARRSSAPSTTDPRKHPLRILIATDAAREGLNLQSHCWNLFHFDVPWNPSRLEQRNGRIDRKLQPNAEVYCHYFVYTGSREDRVLQVLVRKTETIKKELGSLSQVLEGRLAETLKQGIRHANRRDREGDRRRPDLTPRAAPGRRRGAGGGPRAAGGSAGPDQRPPESS